ERRPGPVPDAIDKAVLLRIPVDIIQAALQIFFVTTGMFPKPLLPDAALSLAAAGSGLWELAAARGEITPRECLFDLPPAQRVTGIVWRKGPNAMQMIRQQYDSYNFEGTF